MRKPFNGDYQLTQEFGVNPADYSKFGLKGHDGLDYGLPTGTEVLAPHTGKVIEAAFDGPGYGNYLKIENDKEGSVLAHLQEFKVNIGDQVTEGQLIALSDNTGNSTGAHLHWGYYLFPRDRSNGFAGFINQLPLLAASGNDLATLQKELDQCRSDRDKNSNLYQTDETTIKNQNSHISTLETQVSTLDTQLKAEQGKVEVLQPLADQVPQLQKERDQAVHDNKLSQEAEDGQQKKIQALQAIIDAGKPKTLWGRIAYAFNLSEK